MDDSIKIALDESKNILIIASHADEDSISSGILMKHILQAQGKKTRIIHFEPLNPKMLLLPFTDEVEIEEPATTDYAPYDLVVCVDTAQPGQLVSPKYNETFAFPLDTKILSIDHHRVGKAYATYMIQDTLSPATAELVYMYFIDKIDSSVEPYYSYGINAKEATLLLAGIISDTGSFRWGHLREQTFLVAAKLLTGGADMPFLTYYFSLLNPKLQTYLSHMLPRIEFYDKAGVAMLAISIDDQKNINLSAEETDEFTTAYKFMFAKFFDGYPLGCVLTQRENGEIKCSFRGNDYTNKIDSAEVCKILDPNGGGHFHASACTIREKSLTEAKQAVIDTILSFKVSLSK